MEELYSVKLTTYTGLIFFRTEEINNQNKVKIVKDAARQRIKMEEWLES